VTFVDWDELARWKMINQVLKLGLAEPEETYSSSEHLYQTLNIPAGSTGRLVKAKPVAKVESKEARAPRAKQAAVPVRAERTERTRTRTKKFKES
jgi:hypothetical protein